MKDKTQTTPLFNQVEVSLEFPQKGEQPTVRESIELYILNHSDRDEIADIIWEEYDQFLDKMAKKIKSNFPDIINPALEQFLKENPNFNQFIKNPEKIFLAEMIIQYYTDWH